MTLAEVAAKARGSPPVAPGDSVNDAYVKGVHDAVKAFEADPEFKLPDKIREMAEAYWTQGDGVWFSCRDVARRLRELLEGKQ